MKRPSSRCDSPAFGMIDRAGSPSAGRPIASSASRQAAGPAPQFTPTASAPAAASACRGRPRTAAVDEHEFLAEGQRGDDRHVGGASRLVDRQHELVEVRERLEHDHVGPALEQALDLLAERGPGGRLRDDRHAPSRRTERADRSADQRIAPADLAGLAGELRRAPVEPADLSLEAPGGESPAVGPERQRLDQLRARLEILPMGGPDHLRMTSVTSSSRQARWGTPRLNRSVPNPPSTRIGRAARRLRKRCRGRPPEWSRPSCGPAASRAGLGVGGAACGWRSRLLVPQSRRRPWSASGPE